MERRSLAHKQDRWKVSYLFQREIRNFSSTAAKHFFCERKRGEIEIIIIIKETLYSRVFSLSAFLRWQLSLRRIAYSHKLLLFKFNGKKPLRVRLDRASLPITAISNRTILRYQLVFLFVCCCCRCLLRYLSNCAVTALSLTLNIDMSYPFC